MPDSGGERAGTSKANDEQKPFSVSTLLEVTSMANVACIEELKNAILDLMKTLP